jgi:hypothetical protein
MAHRPLKEIAAEIRVDWKPRKNGAAEPYLAERDELTDHRGRYYRETALDMVSGFLLTPNMASQVPSTALLGR